MALTDLAQRTHPKIRKGPPCSVCAYRASLPEDQAEALDDLLRDAAVRYSVLADMLREDEDYPVDIDGGTFARHARGQCQARVQLR